jgi:hypothetical protein
MPIGRLGQLLQLGRGLPAFLREPVTVQDARAQIRQRMDERPQRFLDLARRLIFGHARSPYRRLLLWAGCTYAACVMPGSRQCWATCATRACS